MWSSELEQKKGKPDLIETKRNLIVLEDDTATTTIIIERKKKSIVLTEFDEKIRKTDKEESCTFIEKACSNELITKKNNR